MIRKAVRECAAVARSVHGEPVALEILALIDERRSIHEARRKCDEGVTA